MDIKVLFTVGALVLSGVGTLLFWAYEAWVERKSKHNHPLDDSLRSYVVSDRTWESCAFYPDFAESVLKRFRFLVDKYDFKRARLRRDGPSFRYRRGDVSVEVRPDDRSDTLLVDLVLHRTPTSFVEVARRNVNGIGRRETGPRKPLTWALHKHLEEEVAALRQKKASS